MPSSRFDAVILDMDGVITRTATLHAKAWKLMFDEYLLDRGRRDGQTYDSFDADTDYRLYVDGKPRYDGVRSFLLVRGITLPHGDPADPPTKETICGLGNRKNVHFHELLQQGSVEVFQDTLAQMNHWKQQGLKLAVISSSRNATEILDSAGVLGMFEVKIDGLDLERRQILGKPAPDMFLQAAADLGISPKRAIIVEDALSGVEAGRAGGFGLVVGVARKGNAKELREHGADIAVTDLRDVECTNAVPPHDASLMPEPPSALDNFEKLIVPELAGKRLSLFLDYDGTLTPIVARPELATLSDEMRAILATLARHCTTAIVSGRDLSNVRTMVGLEELVYAGSHGFDIAGPGGLQLQHEEALRNLPDLDAAEQTLQRRIDDMKGVIIERKRFAIAVHYRLAESDAVPLIEQAVDATLEDHPHLRRKGGKKIFELQPNVEWDKGRAVLWLRTALGVDRPDAITIYIGDDVTDEDAYAAVDQASCGFGILVASPVPTTGAKYSLRDCEEVQQFFVALLERLKED